MRIAIAAIALFVAACGPSAPPAAQAPERDAAAGSSGAGRIVEAPFTVERAALVGTWSFDRSCASGDGMTLAADGAAAFDEWGTGTWTLADNNRIVLTLARSEPGVGPTGETVIYNVDLADSVGDDLVARLTRPDGTEPRGLNAKRCGETP